MFYPALTPVEFQESQHPIVRVDAIAKVSRNKVLPTEISGKQVFHYSIPNVQDIGTGKIEDGDTIDSDKWLITEQAVLISKLNPRKSTICLATPQENVTVTSTEFVVLSAGNSIDNRYLKYVLESEIVRQFLSSRTTSATRSHQRVNPHDITALGIPWPEASSRAKTVNELDRELAEIDKFIAELEKTQELLNEKYEQEVNNLYWSQTDNAIPLKRFIKFVDQGSSPNADNTPAKANEIGILKAGCTAGGEFNINSNKKIIPGTQIKESTFIKKGDLLVTRASGSKEIVGSAAIVGELDRRLALSDKIYRLHSENFEISRYICNVMATKKFREQVELEISGAGGLAKNISLSSLISIKIPFPRNIHELNNRTQNTKINHKLNLKDLEITLYTIREKKDSILSTTFRKQIVL